MPSAPCLLCGQPQELKDEIVQMAKTEHYNVIVEWLNYQGIHATYDQVRYYLSKFHVNNRLQIIKPVIGYKAKVQVYIGALSKHNAHTYTIKNLRLHGSSWSVVTKRLHEDQLIESMSGNKIPIRWRILATRDELQEWGRRQVVE